MDIILDADTFHQFMHADNADMKLILRKWLSERNGKIAYAPFGKSHPRKKEGGMACPAMEDAWMKAQIRAGRVSLASPQEVEKEEKEAWEATRELENSPEIVASLARAEADIKTGRLKNWNDVKRES